MGRPKTIPFDSEKFVLNEHNKATLQVFGEDGYKFRVSGVGGLYGVKGREFKLLDQIRDVKPEFLDWFFAQFD